MKFLLKPVPGLLFFCLAVMGVSVATHLSGSVIAVFIGTGSVVLIVLGLNRSHYFWWVLFFILGGAISYGVRQQISQGWLPENLQGKDINMLGRISGMPVIRGEFARFDVEPVASDSESFPSRIRLTWRNAPDLIPGELWRLNVRLKRPKGFAAEGAFDYEAWIARQGVRATGYVRQGELKQSAVGVNQSLNRFRQSLQNWVLQTDEIENRSILTALLTGDKSGISREQWQQFNRTGTTHLMVISGLHIGLMTALGYWLTVILARLGLLPLRAIPLPVIAGSVGLVFAVFYALLAGFGIPVQRALVMTIMALSGPLLGVRASSPILWCMALAVVLALDPLAFTSAGFWYSFLAVAALLLGLGARMQPRSKVDLFWRPQWVVFVILTPLLLMNGQPVSPLSPLINLLAIPFVGLLMVPLLLLASILHAIWPVSADLLLKLVDNLAGWFQQGLTIIEPRVPLLPEQAALSWPVILLIMLAGLLLISPAALRLRIFAPFLLLPWWFPKTELLPDNVASITVLDIGQGLSVLVQTRRHTLVYDTGDRFSDEVTAADRSLLPTLSRRGIQRIDRVIVSHGDRDHSGGVGSLENKYGSLNILAGSAIPEYRGKLEFCHRGQHWQWDGVDFEVLAGGGYPKSNDCSCVVKVTAGNRSILLTGDISTRVERQMLSDGLPIKADVLLAPHHGSKYSSSKAFLSEIKPEVVIFSAGYSNRFGHPSIAAIERARSVGAHVFNTATDGSLKFTLGSGELNIEAYRKQNDRYWW